MKKLGILTATLLLACSSSSKKPTTMPDEAMNEPTGTTADDTSGMAATEPTDDTATSTDDTDATMAQKGTGMGAASGTGLGSTDAAEQAQEPAAPPAPSASAHLVSMKDGSAMGTVTFEQDGTTINMSGTFNGLTPGAHAFYIHEVGDCSKKGARIGKHLNPSKQKHGPPASAKRHLGDLGDIVADADGNATFEMSTDSVVLEDGRPDSILQRSLVVHAKKDDRAGSGGAPIACGVIEKQGEGGDASSQAAAPAVK
jgi:Cu-Zn family superoxide dismutase